MSYENHRYVLMTVDPVHVGTGGMRLGRVDLSIVREPGTNLPKIPGTALHGAIRSYAAYRYGKRRCAGQGQARDGRKGHCGRATCPICYTFGYVRGEGTAQAHSGVITVTDARILLFPVYSMVGPVWVTSPSTLEDFGIPEQDVRVQEGKAKWPKELTAQGHLNLGWLMVEKEGEWTPKEKLKTKFKKGKDRPDPVTERVVLISDKLFTHVVNSNLEVRTSVSLNPETGAAEEGALFTYEAIPRATFLWLDVVVDDYKGEFPVTEKRCKVEEREEDGIKNRVYLDNAGDPFPNNEKWEGPVKVVEAGLEWAEHLGIGGMGTRGFGRLRKVAEVQQ